MEQQGIPLESKFATQAMEIERVSAKPQHDWIYGVLLALILLGGAYFRLTGVNWDEGQYLHPDERFLAMVETDISPVKCLDTSLSPRSCPSEKKVWIGFKEYFDTTTSSLNPHNQGHGFFVYGTLPIFLVRYVAEWFDQATYGGIANVGRPLSALFDLATVFLIYVIVRRVYDKRVGLLAAAFSALAVLQIQLSHFFTVDIFANFFIWLALYFAVRVARDQLSVTSNQLSVTSGQSNNTPASNSNFESANQQSPFPNFQSLISHPIFLPSTLFGVTSGMAVASKVSAGPIVLMLPVAMFIYLSRVSVETRKQRALEVIGIMGIAGALSAIAFRVFQPYAFSGPGFLNVGLNPLWLDNLRSFLAQVQPESGFPPEVQWFNRPIWFSGQNLTLWGIGLPLGALAWAGFLWMGWRILKGEWRQHLLLWGWVGFYFAWQSSFHNPTMRYQLPVYPGLAIFAAWGIIRLWDLGRQSQISSLKSLITNLARPLALSIGGVALLGALIWAMAFTRIYTRDVTRLDASRWIYQNIPGPINVRIQTDAEVASQPLAFPQGFTIRPEEPFTSSFVARADGVLKGVHLAHVIRERESPEIVTSDLVTIRLMLSEQPNAEQGLVEATLVYDPASQPKSLGSRPAFTFDDSVELTKGVRYYLKLTLDSGGGQISVVGASIANETTWDDGLPMRVDGYDGYGGIYQGGLNFEMYWEDNNEKRERMIGILNDADVVMISSSRQWASLTRLPHKYPLTIAYYRNLLGCPDDRSIEWCYNVADVGTFEGRLGFELANVFQSDPSIGPLRINDQFSEEAFTVYDHPKVFIFTKSDDYDPDQVRGVLGAVSFSAQVEPVTDVVVSDADVPKPLMLPPDRLADQRAGGTWTDIYNSDSILNRSQLVAVFLWYVAVSVIGLVAYPVVRLAMPGLSDRGYPLSRTAGVLMLSYIVWLAGSYAIPFHRITIYIVALVLLLMGVFLAYRQRDELRKEWRDKRGYFLTVEALALGFFLFLLLVRLGNPDLWHPWKGGEKPMDFSYFNAVLKSTTFPPYDPWFSGGYINYYYYGFVFVGVVVKWLGIIPAIAYNLILPTLFMMVALGAFSIGWNLIQARRTVNSEQSSAISKQSSVDNNQLPVDHTTNYQSQITSFYPFLTGLAASLGAALLGNLGTLRMIFRGYQQLAAPPEIVLEEVNLLTRWVWAIQGFFMALSSDYSLPYSVEDWYWFPSRVIPALGDVEPITEFPFFTFLYADLHAHMIALPITLLALAWVVSVILARRRWPGFISVLASFFLGGLAIGSLRPTNTWDFPVYLALGVLGVGYAVWRYYRPNDSGFLAILPRGLVRLIATVSGMALLAGLSFVLFQPYTEWYALGYTTARIWDGSHTPLNAYLTHWGVFLFVILSWMIWETRDWLATTPVSALRKLAPYRELILGGVFLIIAWLGGLIYLDVGIAWFVLPLAVWAFVLLFRPGLSQPKRLVLFLAGIGLVLTLMVEVVVLSGDIGRMNTVFKFYLQSWTLFAISAAAALGWLVPALSEWVPNWRKGWQVVLVGLVFATFLYPLLGGLAKIRDRMSLDAPITLDGMAYMPFSTYSDQGRNLNLDEDYRAIRWMQENVPGTPVIVEAQVVEYRWGSRYAIYTGLPAVLGWNWHQRQQRTGHDSQVWARGREIQDFYMTNDQNSIHNFLDTHDVGYIIVGQLERAYYDGPGIEKFQQLDGVIWQEVYRDGETVIYEVIKS